MEKLTNKQEKILTTIKKFIADNGYSPSIRELCTLCNLSSTATMFVHLKNLTSKGYINQAGSKSRTIELNVPNEYDKKSDNVINVPLLGKVAAGNPIEAIERVKNEHFDLMILDFIMTPIHGDQVVEEIRKFNKDLYILLLTRS